MLASILLSVYLLIGLLLAHIIVKTMEKTLENREKGIKNNENMEKGTDQMLDMFEKLPSQKYAITFLYILMMIGWLPAIIIGKYKGAKEE